MSNRLIQLVLYHLVIPPDFELSLYGKELSASHVILCSALLADGTVGWGEAVPQEEVTGETPESVLYNIEHTLAPALSRLEPVQFVDVLDELTELPFCNEQELLISSARCAVELALLDAFSRSFEVRLDTLTGWLNYGPFLSGPLKPTPVTSLIALTDLTSTRKQLQQSIRQRVKDFKLLLWNHDASDIIGLIDEELQDAAFGGKLIFRIDAQGSWDIDHAVDMSKKLDRLGFASLEQPLAVNDESHFQTLADLVELPIIADESLISSQDAVFLAQNDLIDGFHLCLNKNGGFLPTLQLAEIAVKWSRSYQLGVPPGQAGALGAACRLFANIVPGLLCSEVPAALQVPGGTMSGTIKSQEPIFQTTPEHYGFSIQLKPRALGKFLCGSPLTLSLD